MPIAQRFARLFAGRIHYAWIVVAISFTVILIGVGVRAAPSVLLVPLQQTFGWSADTISGAVSLNILLLGVTGPFITALMQTIGIRRTVLMALVLLLAGAGGSCLRRPAFRRKPHPRPGACWWASVSVPPASASPPPSPTAGSWHAAAW